MENGVFQKQMVVFYHLLLAIFYPKKSASIIQFNSCTYFNESHYRSRSYCDLNLNKGNSKIIFLFQVRSVILGTVFYTEKKCTREPRVFYAKRNESLYTSFKTIVTILLGLLQYKYMFIFKSKKCLQAKAVNLITKF